MLVGYELYRSKYKDQKIDSGYIKVNIDTDIQLIKIDEVVLRVLDQYIGGMDIIKKHGRAYIGRVVIDNLVITDEDTAIDLDEPTFTHYLSTISMLNGVIVDWKKTTTTNITESDKNV